MGGRPTSPRRPSLPRDYLTIALWPGFATISRELLEGVRAGTTSPDDALERLSELPYRDLGFARVDLHRELRQGAPEAVLAEGKTPSRWRAIVAALLEGGAGSVLVDARRRGGARAPCAR